MAVMPLFCFGFLRSELSGSPPEVPTIETVPTVLKVAAGEAIQARRAVVIADDGLAYKADIENLNYFGKVFGISQFYVGIGELVFIQTDRIMTEPNWAFDEGPVWIGADGIITQTYHTTAQDEQGFFQFIGKAISSTQVYIGAEEPLEVTYSP